MRDRRAGLRQVERHVSRLASFHIERGHHYATSNLADDSHAAALYLTRPPDVQPDNLGAPRTEVETHARALLEADLLPDDGPASFEDAANLLTSATPWPSGSCRTWRDRGGGQS